jgi:hypothetical protein
MSGSSAQLLGASVALLNLRGANTREYADKSILATEVTRLALRLLGEKQLLFRLAPVSLGELLVRLPSQEKPQNRCAQPCAALRSHLHRLLQTSRQRGHSGPAASRWRSGASARRRRQLGRHLRRSRLLGHRRLLLHGDAPRSLTLALKLRLLRLALVMDALLRA